MQETEIQKIKTKCSCSPEMTKAIEGLVGACSSFKISFDKGFPNSLNAIQARDKIFDALATYHAAKEGKK